MEEIRKIEIVIVALLIIAIIVSAVVPPIITGIIAAEVGKVVAKVVAEEIGKVTKPLTDLTSAVKELTATTAAIAAEVGAFKERLAELEKRLAAVEKALAPPPPAIVEFRGVGGWPVPPAWHGNPWAPGGVGGCYWYIYEPLFYYLPGNITFIPRLGVSFEEREGGKVLVVKLREGVVWHDDKPFTSKDVLTTFALIGALYRGYWKFIERIEAPDDYTVIFYFTAPLPVLKIRILGEAIRAPHHIYGKWYERAMKVIELWKAEDPRYEEEFKRLTEEVFAFKPYYPVGCGPFKFSSVTESELIVEKWPKHWLAETTYVDRIRIFRSVGNEMVWAMLMAGEIDAAHPATPYDLTKRILAMQPKTRLITVTDLGEFCILINHRRWPLNETKFRRALLYVLDRKKIREVCYWAAIDLPPYNTGILPSFWDLWMRPEFVATLTKYEVDWKKAEELLAELGIKRGPEGLFIDPRTGKPFEFVMKPYGPHTDWVLAGEEIARQLTEFGLKTVVEIIPHDMRKPTYLAGDYDFGIEFGAAWWGTGHPHTGYERIYSGAWCQDFCGYEDFPVITIGGVEYDTGALISELAVTVDFEKQREIVEKLAFVTNEWVPVIDFLEKALMIFHVDGARVTGWPPPEDPVWTIAPGGIERCYVILMTYGILKPVPPS